MKPYYFKSDLFEIEPGEDQEINPGIYGKSLALWLSGQLKSYGYEVDIVGEDWGHCLICSGSPHLLWVGCGNVYDQKLFKDGKVPSAGDVTWQCFVVAEVPFLKLLFPLLKNSPAKKKLYEDLGAILRNEKRIRIVEDA
jgi:hypothetical protein